MKVLRMRKFKADKSEHEHTEFDRLLTEIFPHEIPVNFLSAVKVIYKDGSERTLTNQEIRGIVPNVAVIDHEKIAKLWENTKEVEMYVDIERLRDVVTTNTKNFLKGFGDESKTN